jgi:hypothetical protein
VEIGKNYVGFVATIKRKLLSLHFPDSYLFCFLLGQVCGQSVETETGDKNANKEKTENITMSFFISYLLIYLVHE